MSSVSCSRLSCSCRSRSLSRSWCSARSLRAFIAADWWSAIRVETGSMMFSGIARRVRQEVQASASSTGSSRAVIWYLVSEMVPTVCSILSSVSLSSASSLRRMFWFSFSRTCMACSDFWAAASTDRASLAMSRSLSSLRDLARSSWFSVDRSRWCAFRSRTSSFLRVSRRAGWSSDLLHFEGATPLAESGRPARESAAP
mmetsp:Transcript_62748/g.178222  ORF Transcript_62748/g.178222 Transcript_62748/m.178222 type:complete len:200 (-) Transcript_62748:667-1266(-)